jgi:hypothetical protein
MSTITSKGTENYLLVSPQDNHDDESELAIYSHKEERDHPEFTCPLVLDFDIKDTNNSESLCLIAILVPHPVLNERGGIEIIEDRYQVEVISWGKREYNNQIIELPVCGGEDEEVDRVCLQLYNHTERCGVAAWGREQMVYIQLSERVG